MTRVMQRGSGSIGSGTLRSEGLEGESPMTAGTEGTSRKSGYFGSKAGLRRV